MMRRAILTFGVAVFTGLSFGAAGAQELEPEVTLTGCLAEETEGDEVEYVLNPLEGQDVDIEQIDLVAGEDVNLAPHVGHTVQVAGVLVADDDEGARALRVTRLGHLSASCEAAGG